MYLLYKKELDAAIKAEQRRLISWINETVRLNPDVDLDNILSAADGYVSSTAFELSNNKIVSSSLPVETVTVSAPVVEETTPVEEAVEIEPVVEDITEGVEDTVVDVDDVADSDVNGETIDEILDEEPVREEEITEDVEGDVEIDPKIEDSITDYDNETTEHDVEEIVDVHTPHIPTAEELAEIEKEENLLSFERKNNHLPSREKEEAENKQIKYRKNHQAIFGDPNEIANI